MPDNQRLFDLACCVVVAPLALPIGAVTAVAVRLTSPGPVLHRATRVGRNGHPFRILKFRTMIVGHRGARVTATGDARVTAVGRVLRRLKIDEIPQLVNVLCGEMSIVGPRPEDPYYVEHFADRYREVLVVRPGITGPAAVRFRDEEQMLRAAGVADADEIDALYLRELLPVKLDLDTEYVRSRSLRRDVGVLRETISVLLRGPRERA